MIKITLRGILEKEFGKNWKLNVRSILEIFQALEANTLKFSKCFRNIDKFFTHFMVFVNGKLLSPHLIRSKLLKTNDSVEIVPILQGGGPEIILLIVSIVLTVVSIVLSFLLSPKAPKDVKTSSTILGSIRNVLSRNIVVPIGYGRMRVGSAVISNNIKINYIGDTGNDTDTGLINPQFSPLNPTDF